MNKLLLIENMKHTPYYDLKVLTFFGYEKKTFFFPALKAVASQHPSLEPLSQAKQQWGFALLSPPNVTVAILPSRRQELRNGKRPSIPHT